MGAILVDLYDMIIFLPLWLEKRIKAHNADMRDDHDPATAREVL